MVCAISALVFYLFFILFRCLLLVIFFSLFEGRFNNFRFRIIWEFLAPFPNVWKMPFPIIIPKCLDLSFHFCSQSQKVWISLAISHSHSPNAGNRVFIPIPNPKSWELLWSFSISNLKCAKVIAAHAWHSYSKMFKSGKRIHWQNIYSN